MTANPPINVVNFIFQSDLNEKYLRRKTKNTAIITGPKYTPARTANITSHLTNQYGSVSSRPPLLDIMAEIKSDKLPAIMTV